MIRVQKSQQAPAELATQGYRCDAVARALAADQHGKCYLCERHSSTDYQVDHLLSRKHYPDEVNEWTNLFRACGYCNGKKGDRYDGILRPDASNVEQIIRHDVNLLDSIVLFSSADKSPAVALTMQLLSSIFNGANFGSHPSGKPMRKERERQFFLEFERSYNYFQLLVDAHLSGNDMSAQIRQELSPDGEFLGFKYWIIQDNPRLKSQFADCLIWNKHQNS